MKKIIYTGAFRFPIYDAGAPRVLNNAKIFRALGYEVLFVSWGGEYREEDFSNGKYYYQGFEYLVTGEIEDSDRSFLEKLKGVLKRGDKTMSILRNMPDADVLIAYGASYNATRKLQKYCKAKHISFVSDITEWHAANEFPGGNLSPLYWMSELNMRYLQKRVANKIVISSFLDKYYATGNNLLLPPLVDLQDEKWSNIAEITDEIIVNHPGIRFIYAGTPARKDLLGNVLEAFFAVLKKTNKLQFVVLGVTQDEAKTFVSNPENLKRYSSNLVFLGRVPQTMVPAYYHVADFSILVREPNRKNMAGFPTKVAESIAAGCPVILNRTSDLGVFLTDNKDVIMIDDYSVSSIVAGIERVLAYDTTTVKDMKVNALNAGIKKFDYLNYLHIAKEFINKLI